MTVSQECQWYFLNQPPSLSLSLTGIMSATGNGYVIYMTIKRKTKLKPPELMTVNLAIFDFGISGTVMCVISRRPVFDCQYMSMCLFFFLGYMVVKANASVTVSYYGSSFSYLKQLSTTA